MYVCKTCNAEFDVKAKYAGHISGHARKNTPIKKGVKKQCISRVLARYPFKCEHEGCTFIVNSGREYAGHKRKHAFTFDELISDGSRKVRLLEERGHRCELCGITEWHDHPAPLELDHIDGNPDNSTRENLRLICANCHAIQPTHCGKNVGAFSQAARHKYRWIRVERFLGP